MSLETENNSSVLKLSMLSSTESLSPEEILRREEELEKRAKELEQKEREIQRALLLGSTHTIARSMSVSSPKKNWPPLPEILPVKPCFRQDINGDIPFESQQIMHKLYHVWMLHAIVLMLNALVFTFRLIFLAPYGYSLSGFFLSFVYVFLCIPGSYICWFRPAYKAFKNGSSIYFMIFFFIFFFQFVSSVGMSTLLPGACQIIDGITIMAREGVGSVVIGILVLATGSAFVVTSMADFYLLVKVHKAYKNIGASVLKAQQEVASAAMNNEHVQGAVSNIASQVIQTQTQSNVQT